MSHLSYAVLHMRRRMLFEQTYRQIVEFNETNPLDHFDQLFYAYLISNQILRRWEQPKADHPEQK